MHLPLFPEPHPLEICWVMFPLRNLAAVCLVHVNEWMDVSLE